MPEFNRGAERLSVSEADRQFVAQQLGREPRGLEAVQVRRNNGDAAVIRVASMVDGKPFPTLFWLVDPSLCYQLDQLEASGEIARLQAQIDQSELLQQQLIAEHHAYIALREQLMTEAIRSQLAAAGFEQSLSQKGIGGLGTFTRVRCLHTYYAAHMVQENSVGRLLERL